jgi:hypothetical protein
MTGVCVGCGLPPMGSGVTSTEETPLRLPGTSSAALPAEVGLNRAVVGDGALELWTIYTW